MKRSFPPRLFISILVLALSLLAPGLTASAQGSDYAMVGGVVPSPSGDYAQAEPLVGLNVLPAAADLSGSMPPVRYQGRQSSCVGWAIAYYTRSYQEGRECGILPQSDDKLFSPAFIYNQRTVKDVTQDLGMTMADGLRIASERGVATLATMPYNSSDCVTQPSVEARIEAETYRVDSYVNLFRGGGNADMPLVKSYLAAGEPVLVAVPLYSEFYRVSAGQPTIDAPGPGSMFYGGHAVTLVGYDDQTELFKFVNSWGSWWGDKGYGYFTYDYVQQKCWEAWVLLDSDTTPPEAPARAYELSGALSGQPVADDNAPVFAWDQSEPGATQYLYWGTDPEGTSDAAWEADYFCAERLESAGHYYLRIQTLDAAGNSSGWRTLFDLNYQPQPEQPHTTTRAAVALRAYR